MQKVIISIFSPSKSDIKDFEIPASMTAEEIISRLQETLGIVPSLLSCYKLHSEILDRDLEPDENLEQAGIWDGSILSIHI